MYSEKTLRKRAYKIGYQVIRGIYHFRGAYYTYGEKITGYMVKDCRSGLLEWGCYDTCFDFIWSLEDVEDFLKEQYEAMGLKW